MAYNESDEKSRLENEIRLVKAELASLDSESYDILIRRKFLKQRLADLEYELRQLNKK